MSDAHMMTYRAPEPFVSILKQKTSSMLLVADLNATFHSQAAFPLWLGLCEHREYSGGLTGP